ncbi:MAG: Glu-tRNA(Gln) amidotransferase GatDE subunit E, partial [Thermoplasmata archaeon]|nr:Glu-tRNA(Gln) amidotransferase GatDE subunit E [Thermoplasmata archaeon]
MKAGLEVHQQLATGKLFCRCPVELTETVTGTVLRRLRPTGGETEAVDPAVAFEAARGLLFRYETTPSSCLVEMDEEPPGALDPAALEVALTVALLLHARPVDEVQVMRKIVIDGSNTSGFQRTTLIATDGWIELRGKRFTIATVCLEEDAARKVGEGNGESRFRLDRLGVPLVEVATGPEISSAQEARELAEEIGLLLRATRRVRRGIGTIREDLNVSVPGGTRVEIKGVQELRLLPKYLESERERQELLLSVQRSLLERGAPTPPDASRNVTVLLQGREDRALNALRQDGIALAL